MITFGNEKGWMGAFTRHHAEGAYANGLRVVKLREESGDITPLGTEGVILGSLDGRDLDQRNPDGGVDRVRLLRGVGQPVSRRYRDHRLEDRPGLMCVTTSFMV